MKRWKSSFEGAETQELLLQLFTAEMEMFWATARNLYSNIYKFIAFVLWWYIILN